MAEIRNPPRIQRYTIRKPDEVKQEEIKKEEAKVEKQETEQVATQKTVTSETRKASRAKAGAAEAALQQQLQTQLVSGQSDKPVYRDAGAGEAIDKLRSQQGDINGSQMGTAIKSATEDTDGQAAGKEFHDLNDFVTNNWGRMNPDARAKWAVYKGEVEKQQALGKQGIPSSDYDAMLKRMDAAKGPEAKPAEAAEAPKPTATASASAAKADDDGLGVGPDGSLRKEAAAKVAAESDNAKAKEQLDALNGLSDRLAADGGGSINGYLEKKLQAVNDATEKALKNPNDPVARAEFDLATADLEAAAAKVSLLDTGYRQLTDDGKIDNQEIIDTVQLTGAIGTLDQKVTDAQAALEKAKAEAPTVEPSPSDKVAPKETGPKTGIGPRTGIKAKEEEEAPVSADVARAAGQLATAFESGNDKAVFDTLAGKDKATLQAIEKEFKTATGTDLRSKIESEFGDLKERRALAALDGNHATADALELKRAIEGAGTDEQAILDTVKGKSPEELKAIRAQYKAETGRELDQDLRSDLSRSELADTFRAMGEPSKARAVELREAVQGIGTDEQGILNVFNGAPAAETANIAAAYKELYGENLETRLKDELSGDELAKTFRAMNMKSAAQAVELFEAMDGWGTDEKTILNTLESGSADTKAIAESYQRLYGRSLESHLRDELGGRDLNRALKALGVLG